MKKISDDKKAAVLAEYALGTLTTREIARRTGVSETSVRRILKSEPERVAQIGAKRELDFVAEVDQLIKKGIRAAEMKLDDIISDKEVRDKTQISAITTAIGTLYDKRALASGESTENQTVTVMLPEGLREYAE